MINYKEIFEAWKISMNPTKKQEELAEKRLGVCIGCEYRTEIVTGLKWSELCSACGCPLNKKVFATTFNACPKKKWEDVDSGYLEPIPDKDKNSLI
jgi:hypothetical protein